ncbi:alpha/beta fold hydrolase [Streptomyces cadmiisoli]|uniref:Alpha/beta hydrolase n=1 Tax=Streptomyces cadmiisoli TaxID=2184053 RepID=A0A2Z4JDV9_9ACTN|nr:alpha/beta hydrolase [Streptomyces cadmiisoli]AWW43309.1 alpha/beta hydrolase [Streptomyces cadmiisoli]
MNMSPTEPDAQDGPGREPVSHRARRGLSRRLFVGGAAASAAAGISVAAGLTPSATATTAQAPAARRPKGFGTVATAPRLSAEFKKTFSSRFVNAGGLRQHVVIGGDGPPLLLVHGWPENWYAWRMVMPALARDFTVIAVDQRGMGLTEKPKGGYDTATLANDLVALMDALGHDRFAVAGHDTGMIIGYALAADHPDRVEYLAVADVPGPPSTEASPKLFEKEALNNRLWHIPFNRVDHELIEQLVRGREEAFFTYEFDIQGGERLPEYAREYYIRLFSERESLRGSFGFYRAWDATVEQNDDRAKTKLTMPVLAIGGEKSWGAWVEGGMKPLANDVRGVVIPGAGHWVAEQAPQQMLAALTEFLAPYRAKASRSAR